MILYNRTIINVRWRGIRTASWPDARRAGCFFFASADLPTAVSGHARANRRADLSRLFFPRLREVNSTKNPPPFQSQCTLVPTLAHYIYLMP